MYKRKTIKIFLLTFLLILVALASLFAIWFSMHRNSMIEKEKELYTFYLAAYKKKLETAINNDSQADIAILQYYVERTKDVLAFLSEKDVLKIPSLHSIVFDSKFEEDGSLKILWNTMFLEHGFKTVGFKIYLEKNGQIEIFKLPVLNSEKYYTKKLRKSHSSSLERSRSFWTKVGNKFSYDEKSGKLEKVPLDLFINEVTISIYNNENIESMRIKPFVPDDLKKQIRDKMMRENEMTPGAFSGGLGNLK